MFIKIKQEAVLLFSVKKTVLFLTGIILCTDVNLHSYVRNYNGANLCEFVIFFLTNKYNILMLLTIMVAAVCSDKYGFYNRYVTLLRYKSRSEYYLVQLFVRVAYAFVCIIIFVLIPVLYGKYRGLSGQEPVMFLQVSPMTVIWQSMNIMCYAFWICVLFALFSIIVRNKIADVLLIMGLPLINLMVVKAGIYWLAKWLPWQNIAFELYGWEISNYRLYWEYWLILISVFLYIGDSIFSNKDIVYENC